MERLPRSRVPYALAVVPLIVGAVGAMLRARHDVPVGDVALTELVTRDIGRAAVLVGPYSRDGWHHPGPALYYLLALPYRLLGATPAALRVGALAVNGATLVGMALVARRRGGNGLALITLVAGALLVRSLGPAELQLAWNPYLTVLPYGLLVFLVWALACGDRWALPVAVGVGSFVAQTHVGYVALALPLVAVGAGWLVATTVVTSRRGTGSPGWRVLAAPAAAAVGIAVVMWLPPVAEQLTSHPGNLGEALSWFREGGAEGEPARGWRAGWRVVTAQYAPAPEWLVGMRPVTFTAEPGYLYAPEAPVLLVAVAAAGVALRRLGMAASGPLVAVWGLASLAGVAATARVVGPVYEYRLGWARVLGMVGGVVVAWAVWAAVARRWPAAERRLLVPAAVAALVALAAVGAVAHVEPDLPQGKAAELAGAVVPRVVAELPPGDGPVVVDGTASFESAGYAPALMLALDRSGVEARTPEGPTVAGRHRAHSGGPVRAHLVVAGGEAVVEVAARPGARLLAYEGELSLAGLRARVAAGAAVPPETALAVYRVPSTSDSPQP